jgi:streptomycin 6-kinase
VTSGLERLEQVTAKPADSIDGPTRLKRLGRVTTEWADLIDGTTRLEPLGRVTTEWADLVETRMERLRPGFDAGLVAHGTRLLRELPFTAEREVVVHGDFNPGNVLAARRRPWLAIDAKAMIGDPGYDPWPLVEQVDDPFAHSNPSRVLAHRFALVAGVLGQDESRLQAWSVARRVETALWAVDQGDPAGGAEVMEEARILADLAGL